MTINPVTARARQLRQTANGPEQALWAVLKGKQLGGYKFTRQFPVGPYVADFACRSHFLLIELDGGQHVDCRSDAGRDRYLHDEGYSVLRFPGASALRARDAVCETILAALDGRLEDCVNAFDLRIMRSEVLPRRFRRHRPWVKTPME